MLREGIEAVGEDFDMQAVTRGLGGEAAGVPQAALLVAYAEAFVGTDESALAVVRAQVVEALGSEGLVDVAGVASNFERMVRIADGTGIPLDGYTAEATEGLRQALGIDRFPSAAERTSGQNG